MAVIEGFDEIADELEELANSFENLQDKHGHKEGISVKGAIRDGIARAVEDEVLPLARSRARHDANLSRFEARKLKQEPIGWRRDTYRHEIGAPRGTLALYFEHGTGAKGAQDPHIGVSKYSGDGKATVNAVNEFGRTGYRIPKLRESDPVEFNVDGHTLVTEYVVHPGISGKHYVRNALDSVTATNAIEDKVHGFLGEQFARQLNR